MNSIDPAITGLLAAKESAVQTQIAFALAAKQLETQKAQGAAATELIEAAAQIGKALGRGAGLDVQV